MPGRRNHSRGLGALSSRRPAIHPPGAGAPRHPSRSDRSIQRGAPEPLEARHAARAASACSRHVGHPGEHFLGCWRGARQRAVARGRAAAAWHAASARKKISGALPGGIDAAKVHLDRAAALVESSTECDVLREALALRDQHKGVLTKAAAAGVTREVESILSGRTRSPMTAWRPTLRPGQLSD